MVAFPHEPQLLRNDVTGQHYAWILVEAEPVDVPGLALTAVTTLTHLGSGCQVAVFPDQKSAKRCATALKSLADWKDELPLKDKAHGETLRAVIVASGGIPARAVAEPERANSDA